MSAGIMVILSNELRGWRQAKPAFVATRPRSGNNHFLCNIFPTYQSPIIL